jgi:hypothetical protein
MSDAVVTATIAERGKVYGDPQSGHANIGLSWTALLQQHYGVSLPHPLPDYVVAQMMVCFKMQRACRVYKDDNYIDAHAYTRFADQFQQKHEPITTTESAGASGKTHSKIGEPDNLGEGGLSGAGSNTQLLRAEAQGALR